MSITNSKMSVQPSVRSTRRSASKESKAAKVTAAVLNSETTSIAVIRTAISWVSAPRVKAHRTTKLKVHLPEHLTKNKTGRGSLATDETRGRDVFFDPRQPYSVFTRTPALMSSANSPLKLAESGLPARYKFQYGANRRSPAASFFAISTSGDKSLN